MTTTTGEAMTYHINYDTEAFPPNRTGLMIASVPQKQGGDYTLSILATYVSSAPDGSFSYEEVRFFETSRGHFEPKLLKGLRVLPETVKAFNWRFESVETSPSLSTLFVRRQDWTSTISECD
jgi:hypothetical protein